MLANNLIMVTGPVCMTGKSLIQRLQAIEFSGLIGYGAIMLQTHLPGMCNGANLAYRKTAIQKVGGYEDNNQIPSGDDEFLLQKIHEHFPDQVSFLKSSNAIVRTPSKSSVNQLINQRIRWTSKWKFHKSSFTRFTSIIAFGDFLLGLAILPLAIFYSPSIVVIIILGRMISETIYLRKMMIFMQFRAPITHFILLNLIYPFYAVFLGLASIFGKYSWKGRKYQ